MCIDEKISIFSNKFIRAWGEPILFCMTDMKKSPTGPASICLLKVTIETLKHSEICSDLTIKTLP